jgi:exosome complex component RRP41
MPRSGQVTLLQMDGQIEEKELAEALELARKGCEKIKEIQIKALREKYGGSAAE